MLNKWLSTFRKDLVSSNRYSPSSGKSSREDPVFFNDSDTAPGLLASIMGGCVSLFGSEPTESEARQRLLHTGLEEQYSQEPTYGSTADERHTQTIGLHNNQSPISNGGLQPRLIRKSYLEGDQLRNLEGEIRLSLRALKVGPSDQFDARIILPSEVEKFWSTSYRSFYRDQAWYDPEWDREDLLQGYHRILSILIMIKFDRWREFRDLFIQNNRDDSCIPFDKEVLQNDEFLHEDLGESFFEMQWLFCPLVIQEAQQPLRLTGKEVHRRFPYITQEEKIGFGASCTVYKQVIAARHLRYSGPLRTSETFKPKRVACKVVEQERVEDIEFENLQNLRGYICTHDRIMVNIATFITGGDLKPTYTILYDLAAYDLYTLLTERCNEGRYDHAKDHRLRRDSASPRRNNSHDHRACDLIEESQNLADALDFLHNRLYSNGHWSLAHNDLKPANILVFYPEEEEKRYPVGQWKIADFGLAKIKINRHKAGERSARPAKSHSRSPPPRDPSTLAPDFTHRRKNLASMSITNSKRNPGMYTPPELRGKGEEQPDSRAGDLWAFGCVLSEVLAYAVSPHLVAELQKENDNGRDFRYYDESNMLIKDKIAAWLKELPSRCKPKEGKPDSTKWVKETVELILKILVTSTAARLPAGEIRDQLASIRTGMDRDADWSLEARAIRGEPIPMRRRLSSASGVRQEFHMDQGSPSQKKDFLPFPTSLSPPETDEMTVLSPAVMVTSHDSGPRRDSR